MKATQLTLNCLHLILILEYFTSRFFFSRFLSDNFTKKIIHDISLNVFIIIIRKEKNQLMKIVTIKNLFHKLKNRLE